MVLYTKKDAKKGRFVTNAPVSGTYTVCFKNESTASILCKTNRQVQGGHVLQVQVGHRGEGLLKLGSAAQLGGGGGAEPVDFRCSVRGSR